MKVEIISKKEASTPTRNEKIARRLNSSPDSCRRMRIRSKPALQEYFGLSNGELQISNMSLLIGQHRIWIVIKNLKKTTIKRLTIGRFHQKVAEKDDQ